MNFKSIISSYDYHKLKEKGRYDYLLDNKIYLRPELLTKELENKLFKDLDRFGTSDEKWIDRHYNINPLIIEDIISQFFEIDHNITDIKSKINLELEYSLNKEETLKKYYNENINIINQYDIPLSTFYQKNKINNKKLKELLINHFKLPDCYCINIINIESFIIKDVEFNLYSIDIYKKLIETIYSLEIIKYLKTKQQVDGKTPKTKEIKIYSFKNYFNKSKINKKSIEQLQLDYKGKTPKYLALLIFILNQLKIANTNKRLHFICSLKNKKCKWYK